MYQFEWYYGKCTKNVNNENCCIYKIDQLQLHSMNQYSTSI